MPMNVLGWRLPPAGCTTAFIVLVIVSTSTATFLTRRRLWFSWWLVSIGSIWGTCTPSDIKNYRTSCLKLLKNFAEISNGNPTSCSSTSILKSKHM